MKKYIYVAIGGALGALLRYAIKIIDFSNLFSAFPINTFIINISGSFLIALILTFASKKRCLNENIKVFLTTGFLGAFTTFSTFCRDTVGLMEKGIYITALVYIAFSIVLGMLAAYLGYKLSLSIMSRREKEIEEEQAG
ncbi:fluoride efflux transporter CrcB [Clostridium sp. 19966]|uniref:fluoride efflux transporter CrcB n=1 Tax=Clostridium sp. 19966 TaxID=2768166 RepID=UPI0028DDCC65|nr:fluoride efflux transporter CrcB [Clostridium sp. 19966]MDT8716202.1 fluoride efflux transporter CrcB [Clostridium sp. 19966]